MSRVSRRALRDIGEVQMAVSANDNNITAVNVDDNNMSQLSVSIEGPVDTAYAGQSILLTIELQKDYPFNSPSIIKKDYRKIPGNS